MDWLFPDDGASSQSRLLKYNSQSQCSKKQYSLKKIQCFKTSFPPGDYFRGRFNSLRDFAIINEIKLAFIINGPVILILDSVRRKVLKRLTGHERNINEWIKSRQYNNIIITGSSDTTIRIWNIYSGACLQIFNGHTQWVGSIKERYGREIVSGSGDKTLKIWPFCDTVDKIITKKDNNIIIPISDQPNQSMKLEDKCSNILILHEYDKVVCSCVQNIMVYGKSSNNSNTLQLEKLLYGHSGWIKDLIAIDNETRIISYSQDKSIRIWDWQKECCIKTFWEPYSIIQVIQLNKDMLLSFSNIYDEDDTDYYMNNLYDDGNITKVKIRLLDMNNRKCIQQLDMHNNYIVNSATLSLTFSSSFKMFVTTSHIHKIEFWRFQEIN